MLMVTLSYIVYMNYKLLAQPIPVPIIILFMRIVYYNASLIPGAWETLKVVKEHEIQLHDNPSYVLTFEIYINIIPVLT